MTYPGALNCCTECTGELIINVGGSDPGLVETTMHTPAWCCVDLTPLYMGGETRGGNVTVPGAIGTRAQRRRIDETEYSLPFGISGVTDKDGTLASNPHTQLYTNIAYLRENVVDPPPNGAKTRTAQLTLPDGMTVLTADIQVISLQEADHLGPLIRAVMKIMIPLGRFTT